MATAARDRLARTLRGDTQAAFSVELTAGPDDLSLAVEGFGPVKFPVTPAKARKLTALGQPARFGRGEETLTDPDVRDTWEIPKHLVRAEWDAAMPQRPVVPPRLDRQRIGRQARQRLAGQVVGARPGRIGGGPAAAGGKRTINYAVRHISAAHFGCWA